MHAIRLAVIPVVVTLFWALVAGWCFTQLAALPGRDSAQPAQKVEQVSAVSAPSIAQREDVPVQRPAN